MLESEASLVSLYDWTIRCEEELHELQSAFPEVMRADRDRLVMSFRCLRIGLEIRVKSFPKRERIQRRPPAPPKLPPPLPRRLDL